MAKLHHSSLGNLRLSRFPPHVARPEARLVCQDGAQNSAVEAGTAGMEPLQPVDGRKADLGVVEGDKLPIHVGPGQFRGVFRVLIGVGLRVEHSGREARLCGRVGEWIGGPVGRMCAFGTWRTGMPGAVSNNRLGPRRPPPRGSPGRSGGGSRNRASGSRRRIALSVVDWGFRIEE